MNLLVRISAAYAVFYYCHAFHASVGVPAGTKFENQNRLLLHRQRSTLRKSTRISRGCRMSYLHHDDAIALADVLSQATQVLTDATDAARGGAVVEQIPYVAGDPSTIPDFSKIVLGSAACVIAYAWAAYEFGSRIVTQRACEVCGGSGLVSATRSGRKLTQPRKCYACGGFLPWENWGRFWQTNMDVGNGGVLQKPASDYDELNKAAKAAKEAKLSDKGKE